MIHPARWQAKLFIVVSLCLVALKPLPGFCQAGGLESLYPWPEDPANLVTNPSFEQVGSNGLAVGWNTSGAGAYFFPTMLDSHTGLWGMLLKDSNLDRWTPSATQALSLKPGWYNLRGWMKAQNAGTNRTGAGGRISLWTSRSNWTSTNVIRGTTDWVQVNRDSFSILPGESGTVRLEAYGQPDGKVFFDDIELHRQIPPIVEGFLLYPNYRGVIFQDRSQIIKVSVTVRSEEAGLTLAGVAVRLFLETDRGTVVATTANIVPQTDRFVLSLNASSLSLGNYWLRLQAIRVGSGQVLFEYPAYRIVKAPSAWRSALSAYVDSDNVLVLNGQRRFVLGIYDTAGYSNRPSAYEPRISKIAEAPINLYLNYWLGAAPVSALNALMTTLQKYGMAYLQTSNIWYQDSQGWPANLPCNGVPAGTLGQDGFTACMASNLGTNLGLAGWYTADEEPASQAERVFRQYSILRENDPGGVTFIAEYNPRELVRWRDATDVMGVDPYPIYNVPADKTAPLEMVTQWVEQAQNAVENSRPVWAVIQFFQFGSKGHWPTYDELRSMSYMAIVAGAKGLFYWSYGARALSYVKDPTLREEYWQRLVSVTTEIKSLEDALISPDSPDILENYGTNGSLCSTSSASCSIRVLGKQVGGTRYLIAVNNTSRTGIAATFSLTNTAGSVEVIGEGRTVPISGTAFTDTFYAYQTHVYKITVDSTPPTVSITSPANGSNVLKNSTVTIRAAASDNVGVRRVDFYVNSSLVCSVATAPYTCAWKVPETATRSYMLQATAYDTSNNVGRSNIVAVTAW